nr:hypothetical protein [Tanacetum cinerariifolium]
RKTKLKQALEKMDQGASADVASQRNHLGVMEALPLAILLWCFLCVYRCTLCNPYTTLFVTHQACSCICRSINAKSHSGIYGRRFGIKGQNTSNNMSRERHDMIVDDAGNALLYSTTLGSINTQRQSTISPCFFPLTISPSDNTILTILDHPLILTSEFGPRVTPEARLTRVVPLCVGATPHQWPEISSDIERSPEQEIASTNWCHLSTSSKTTSDIPFRTTT